MSLLPASPVPGWRARPVTPGRGSCRRRGSFFLAAGNRVFSALPSREVSRGRSFGADKDHRKRRRVDGREAVLDHSGRGPLSAPSFQVTLVVDVR